MEWSELIRRFKREAGTADLPVIVHTGKSLKTRERTDQEGGGNYHFQGC
jgi:hypothetical protein